MPAEQPELNPCQQAAITAISVFLHSETPIFLLQGSAGTGKTTLVAHLIRLLNQQHRKFQVIAPTGRAARILGTKTQTDATTIHSVLYAKPSVEVFEEAVSINDPGMRWHFPLKEEDPGATVFIVDESSMVGDKEAKGDLLRFGSGRLLTDLIRYARLGREGRVGEHGAKIIFVGDPAQLPPVGETLSPAMCSDYLKQTFALDCQTFELTEVMRQQTESAILDRATELRNRIGQRDYNRFDLKTADSEIIATSITEAISRVETGLRSKSSSVLITYSNSQAFQLNRALRGRLWGDEDADLRQGDLLLVNKNSFLHDLSNGDLVKVRQMLGSSEQRAIHLNVKGEHERVPVELAFRQVEVAYRAGDGSIRTIRCRLLENLLNSPERELTPLEQRALLVDFRIRNPELRPKTNAFSIAFREDPYFNALQVKYGYAMTCHKAQGGEWQTAVVNFEGGHSARNEQFFRWSYTAITRAQRTLITINAPSFTPTSGITWDTLGPSPQPESTSTTTTPPTDDDWNRWSFNAGQETLFAYHVALREAWSKRGICIEHLDHLQYTERYLLSRDGRAATVQYHYKGNHKISKTQDTPSSASDPELLDAALTAMHEALSSMPADKTPLSEPFLAEFHDKLNAALEGTEIRIVATEPMPYRLRIEFETAGRRAKIDFYYNGKQTWTSAIVVGGPGASGGLIDRVQQLLDQVP
ncbi:AAA family ATPase [Allochromatium palmeri]|uniref:AAA family ATPase n=1 Tax=Allochromatium palmeri TaxID=231048 RepID=A0A6N8ECK3_9GAMM|nr:AAA family ATPase [Allochromatium palmeri]MTW21943.1 AAA family ATPase [Allochromatium palmeri]